MTGRRSGFVTLARAANAIFFLMTATYRLLSYSAFASRVFIKAHLVVWLTDFVVWHHLWFLVALGITALTITSEPPRARGRRVAWAYLAVGSALGVVLLLRSVLPDVENNGRGLVFALVALVPPIWLALVDHLATAPAFAPAQSSETRVVGACLVAGVVVWLEQAVLLPWRLSQTGDITLTGGDVAFGLVASAIGHLALFSLFAIMMLAMLRLARLPVFARAGSAAGGTIEYWLLGTLAAIVITLIVYRLVFAAIAFTGPAGWLVSVALAVTMTMVWSGMARRRSPDVSGPRATALEVWLSPFPGVPSRAASIVVLAALTVVGFVVMSRVAALDWDFLVQKLVVVALWLLAFVYSFGATGDRRSRTVWRLIAIPLTAFAVFGASVVAMPQLPGWTGHPAFVPEFVLEGFVAADPSFRLISDLLHVDSPKDAEFYAYLRANTIIQHVDVAPVDIDFAKPIGPPREPRPDIYLFVIDSMRRDYLSVYNPSVGFTPEIARFASESVVFDRAYTRYGGTALSVPAMWAGGMLLPQAVRRAVPSDEHAAQTAGRRRLSPVHEHGRDRRRAPRGTRRLSSSIVACRRSSSNSAGRSTIFAASSAPAPAVRTRCLRIRCRRTSTSPTFAAKSCQRAGPIRDSSRTWLLRLNESTAVSDRSSIFSVRRAGTTTASSC